MTVASLVVIALSALYLAYAKSNFLDTIRENCRARRADAVLLLWKTSSEYARLKGRVLEPLVRNA